MQLLGLRHHNGEAPQKPLSPEEQMHQDRLLTRIESGMDADRAALVNYPGLVGKLGSFEIDPAIAAQLDASHASQDDTSETATPARDTAEVAGRFANVPTPTIEMPANSAIVPAETDQNRADIAAWEREMGNVSGMPADRPEPNILEERVPTQQAQEAYNEYIG